MSQHEVDPRWAQLAGPTPKSEVQWRIVGQPKMFGDSYRAMFVAYVDSRYVQARLDAVFPGEWSLTQDVVIPAHPDRDGVDAVTMKASLTIAGVTRECVGADETYKGAASDSFKRAGVRFGIAADLYELDPNWVKCDARGKPLEDAAEAYARRAERKELSEEPRRDGAPVPGLRAPVGETTPSLGSSASRAPASASKYAPTPCPECGAKMWDNRATKRGKQPDYKCTKSPKCDGATWLTDEERTAVALADPDDDGLPF